MSVPALKIAKLREDSDDFIIDDKGRVALMINVSNECNFEKANEGFIQLFVPLEDLEGFLAGLTVSPAGIDGSCDEVTVKVFKQNGEYELLVLDHYVPELHNPYVHWTEDNDYQDDELTELQYRLAIESTLVKDITPGQRFGMFVEMYHTVFADNLPQSFIDGLMWFQELSHSCFTHAILGKDAPDEKKIGSTYSNNHRFEDSGSESEDD